MNGINNLELYEMIKKLQIDIQENKLDKLTVLFELQTIANLLYLK